MAWRRTRVVQTAAGEGERVPGYTDLRRIGRGGFSVIYRARQERYDREVALKVLAVEFIDAHTRNRYLREVKLTGRLTGHPNVVTVLDSGMTAAGRPYLAMEYFSRGSLADRLAAEGPLPVEEVLRIGAKIAGALAAAHELDIVHRDVKPQNILVSRYGEPALADFGTARLTAGFEATHRTEALTTYHAAPEVLQGAAGDATCDVYSLGSTLYHLLAGRLAFPDTGDGLAGLLLRIVSSDPPPIHRPDLPASAVAVIHKAMAKQPEDRFPDALSLAEALRNVLDELSPASGEQAQAPAPFPINTEPIAAEPVTLPPTVEEQNPDEDPTLETGRRQPPLFETAPGAQPEQAGDEPGKRRRRLTIAGLIALAVIAAAVPLLFSGSHGKTEPQAVPTTAAPTTTAIATATVQQSTTAAVPSPTAPISQPDIAAAKPVDVTGVDKGATVYLSWHLPASATGIIEVQAQAVAGPVQSYPLSAGVNTYQLSNLNPGTGYCFKVGVNLQLAPTVIMSWSDPYCIRGATPAN